MKWTNPGKDFVNYFGKASSGPSSYIPNFVSIAPSKAPLLHKFRDEERERWLSKTFKF